MYWRLSDAHTYPRHAGSDVARHVLRKRPRQAGPVDRETVTRPHVGADAHKVPRDVARRPEQCVVRDGVDGATRGLLGGAARQCVAVQGRMKERHVMIASARGRQAGARASDGPIAEPSNTRAWRAGHRQTGATTAELLLLCWRTHRTSGHEGVWGEGGGEEGGGLEGSRACMMRSTRTYRAMSWLMASTTAAGGEVCAYPEKRYLVVAGTERHTDALTRQGRSSRTCTPARVELRARARSTPLSLGPCWHWHPCYQRKGRGTSVLQRGQA